MSMRELGTPATSLPAPLTRREAREREDAQRVAEAKALYLAAPQSRSKPSARKAVAVAARPTKKHKKVGSKILSTGALLVAGAMMVAVSVPSNAFLSDAAALAPAVAATTIPGQTLAVSEEAVMAGADRDTYTVTSYAELLRAQYGNSGRYTATTGAIRWPFPYSVPTTDGFGPRPVWISGNAFHNGTDFTPGGGSPIYAIADGVVTLAVNGDSGLGTYVIIQHSIPGQNVESVYAHMQLGSSPLQVGDPIGVGDFIGLVGNTGVSWGSHLHLEIHIDKVPVNPFTWLTDHAVN